jgi:hypothetical protein
MIFKYLEPIILRKKLLWIVPFPIHVPRAADSKLHKSVTERRRYGNRTLVQREINSTSTSHILVLLIHVTGYFVGT